MTRNQRFNPHPGHPNPNAVKKQQERAIRDAHRKERKIDSYLADDENFPSFAIQLKKLGLQLRDIPGDGNCLFRALGDQLEGHGRNHYQHRQETVRYMMDHRHDFEPFVEDDVPFDDHVNNLRKLGTYAGNDAIVAFAKLHDVNVMIHQLNGKPLMIQGPSVGGNIRQLHLAYHNGDHYSSIRSHGDGTEAPANIQLQEDSKLPAHTDYSEGSPVVSHQGVDYLEAEVMKATGCQSVVHIREALEDCDYDADAAIATLMQTMELGGAVSEETEELSDVDRGLWGPEGTGSRIFGGEVSGHCHGDSSSSSSGSLGGSRGSGARPKHSGQAGPAARRGRETKKQEKKRRAEERHRQRFLGSDPQRQLQRDLQQQEDAAVVIKHDVTRI